MISNIYLVCFIVVLFEPISTLPHYRYRRQINLPPNHGSFYGERLVQSKQPSDSIVGTYYYGTGSDPNYGSFLSRPNSANLGDPSGNQGYQNSLYNNNNNNAWQQPNMNNYYNPFYNRYPPGSPGWYATGGNYWYNNGQSIIAHPYLLLISIAILFFCK